MDNGEKDDGFFLSDNIEGLCGDVAGGCCEGVIVELAGRRDIAIILA